MMDRSFYKKLMAIAMPIAFQNMISYSINMVDTLMLGRMGESVLSASSLAGQVFFMFTLLMGGVASGAGILCNQYYGRQDMEKLRTVVAILVKIAVSVSLVFVAGLLLVPEQIMWLFTGERDVILLGASYLRTIAVSYLCYGITISLLIALRSVHNVVLSFWIYALSLVVNIFFNYMFIFGKFGAPELGIVGAAVGTVIARGTETVLVVCYLKWKEDVLKWRWSMLRLHDRELLKDVMKYGLPVIAGESLWGLGVSVHCSILGHMGAVVVAANSICNVLHQFVLALVQGFGSASSVIIGSFVGAEEYSEAKRASKVLVRIFIVCGIVMSGLLLAVMNPFFTFYHLEPETLRLARQFMIVYAVITLFRSIAGPTLCGILWGAGDTKFSATIDITFLWALVPVGVFAAFVLGWAPAAVLLVLRLESPLKAVVALFHIRGEKWMKRVTR